MSGTTLWTGPGALAVAYLIGAFPFGYWLVRLSTGSDIRSAGSGNIGATNAMRVGGKGVGLLTLALDAAKGLASVAVARWITDGEPAWCAAAAFCSVLGHCYPIYLRFRGGKGIATGCGAYGLLAPIPMALTLGVFVAALLLSRMVSVGSISAGIAMPLLVWWLMPDPALLASVIAAALLVITRHRPNILRILHGEEHRLERSAG